MPRNIEIKARIASPSRFQVLWAKTAAQDPVSITLVLTALALPVSIAAANTALVLLAAALLMRARSDGRKMLGAWREEPALAALAFYAAASLAAAALSAEPRPALRDALKDLHRLWALGLFTAALRLESGPALAAALGVSFAAAAALAIAQPVIGDPDNWRMTRAHGFVHPVVFGEQMALAALGAACLLLRPDPRAGRRALLGTFIALVFTALVLSQTRMALIAAVFAFAAICVFEPRARRWALLAAVLFVAAAAAWELMPTGGRGLSALLARRDPNDPQQVRWALWDAAWRMFKDHPLTGVGPGGYRRLFTAYHQGALDGETVWGSSHNLYLHQLAERGLLGFCAILSLAAVLLTRALRAARQAGDARSLWAVAAVVILLLMSLTETSFQNEQFATLLLLIWAWGTTGLRKRGKFL